jgi:uncharacterized RmlC-like cupin family protein
MGDAVRLISPKERTLAPAVGMVREEAISTGRMWSGFVRAEPGMNSAWHHHGDYDTSIFVISGGISLEFGPGGVESVDAGPGDFLYVAPGAVHRESNRRSDESHFIVVRSGSGEPVFNVDGPEGT